MSSSNATLVTLDSDLRRAHPLRRRSRALCEESPRACAPDQDLVVRSWIFGSELDRRPWRSTLSITMRLDAPARGCTQIDKSGLEVELVRPYAAGEAGVVRARPFDRSACARSDRVRVDGGPRIGLGHVVQAVGPMRACRHQCEVIFRGVCQGVGDRRRRSDPGPAAVWHAPRGAQRRLVRQGLHLGAEAAPGRARSWAGPSSRYLRIVVLDQVVVCAPERSADWSQWTRCRTPVITMTTGVPQRGRDEFTSSIPVPSGRLVVGEHQIEVALASSLSLPDSSNVATRPCRSRTAAADPFGGASRMQVQRSADVCRRRSAWSSIAGMRTRRTRSRRKPGSSRSAYSKPGILPIWNAIHRIWEGVSDGYWTEAPHGLSAALPVLAQRLRYGASRRREIAGHRRFGRIN